MNFVNTDDFKFVRDTNSKALLNNDNNGLKLYRARRAAAKKESTLQVRVDELEAKVARLEKLVGNLSADR